MLNFERTVAAWKASNAGAYIPWLKMKSTDESHLFTHPVSLWSSATGSACLFAPLSRGARYSVCRSREAWKLPFFKRPIKKLSFLRPIKKLSKHICHALYQCFEQFKSRCLLLPKSKLDNLASLLPSKPILLLSFSL